MLEEYEGQEVAIAGMKINNQNDWINRLLAFKPVKFQHGDTVLIMLQGVVTGVNYRPINGEEDKLIREHVVRAQLGTIAFSKEEIKLLSSLLLESTDALSVEMEKKQGIERFEFE